MSVDALLFYSLYGHYIPYGNILATSPPSTKIRSSDRKSATFGKLGCVAITKFLTVCVYCIFFCNLDVGLVIFKLFEAFFAFICP